MPRALAPVALADALGCMKAAVDLLRWRDGRDFRRLVSGTAGGAMRVAFSDPGRSLSSSRSMLPRALRPCSRRCWHSCTGVSCGSHRFAYEGTPMPRSLRCKLADPSAEFEAIYRLNWRTLVGEIRQRPPNAER